MMGRGLLALCLGAACSQRPLYLPECQGDPQVCAMPDLALPPDLAAPCRPSFSDETPAVNATDVAPSTPIHVTLNCREGPLDRARWSIALAIGDSPIAGAGQWAPD